MLIVAPLNSIRSNLQQSLKIVWNIMNNPTSEFYTTYNLDKYKDKIEQISMNSKEFLSCLEKMIINPEKLFHLLFNNEIVKKKLEKIVIDEYHVENNFYQVFLLMMPTFITKYYPNIEIVLASGTPTIKLDSTFHLPSNITKQINRYDMCLFKKRVNKKNVYTYKIENFNNVIFDEIKKNKEKILIIGNSKKKSRYLKKIIFNILRQLKLQENNIIYVNSDNPLNLEKINKVNECQLIIASPNSVTQGPTIKSLRLIINFNCYPILPKLLPENSENISSCKLYKNTSETNQQIEGRMGRIKNQNNIYHIVTCINNLEEKKSFLDILAPIILLHDYLDIDIYDFIIENITTENMQKIFKLDKTEWIDNTRIDIIKQLEMLASKFFNNTYELEWIDNTRIDIIKQLEMLASKFFNNTYESDNVINKMFTYFKQINIKKFDHNLSFRFIEAYLYYNNIDKTIITQILNQIKNSDETKDLDEYNVITWEKYFNKLNTNNFTNNETVIIQKALSNFISKCKIDNNDDDSDDDDSDDDDNDDNDIDDDDNDDD
jgi:hypothetical protein